MNQLATGKRVNSAKDDPSTLALANSLESSIRSLQAVDQGISQTQGVLDTAAGGLSSTLDSLQQLRELAVQSANGTLSDSNRENLQQQYDQTLQHIDTVSSQTSFNGQSLLDGSFSQNVSTGGDSSSTSVSIDSVSSSALGLSSTGIATQSGAQDALASIDSAISQVQSQMASIGASQNALEFSSDANAVQAENLAAAKSDAVDLNVADAVSQLQQQQIQIQAQLAAIKAKGKNDQSVAKSLFSTKA